MKTQVIHEGTFRPTQEKTFIHLPFDVPPGATRLDVNYSYTNPIGSNPFLSGGNTIDLGVFDARGISFQRAGFRGWSGSERSSFYISETSASPGYLPGPLIPGRWYVHLGLYKVAPDGGSYRVEVTITSEAGHAAVGDLPSPVVALPSSPPPARSAPWLCGELHCHTWHSDGDSSPADVVALARQRGLDFLAISDHNTIACHRELATLQDPGLILIPAVEVTTFHGHFNVWGIGDWVDFRVQTAQDMAAALHYAHERGAITSCSHPKPFGPPWDYAEVTDYDCVEVWNGPWFLINQIALDFWTRQIAAGRRIPAVAGSDWHRRSEMADDPPRAPGTPCVWVYVAEEASAQAILQAIRRGHVVMSDEPAGPLLDMRAGSAFSAMGGDTLPRPFDGRLPLRVHCRRGAGYRLQLLDQNGVLFEQVLHQPDEVVTAYLDVAASLFVRAELRAGDEAMKALTNPVYLD